MKITAVTAGLGVPSSSRLLADQLASAVRTEAALVDEDVDVETVEVRDFIMDIASNLATGFASPTLESMLSRLIASDALIVVSPVFSGSYSGLLKSLFDVVDNTALEGMPVILGATGGSARHALMLEHAMRPLFTYLRARVVPTAVYAAPQDWGAGTDDEPALEQRTRRAARELLEILGSRAAGRRQTAAPESLPFEDLLAKVRKPVRQVSD